MQGTKEIQSSEMLFRASKIPAHEEILRILHENEPDTITILAIGPLTNLARAAAIDAETFLRAKEIVVMGGVVEGPGNVQSRSPHPVLSHSTVQKLGEIIIPPFNLIKGYPSVWREELNNRNQVTPVAEFNVHADSVAAARVFALTSKNPAMTLPHVPLRDPNDQDAEGHSITKLRPYPSKLSKPLSLTLFSLGKYVLQ